MFFVPVIFSELASARGCLGSGRRKLPWKETWPNGFLFISSSLIMSAIDIEGFAASEVRGAFAKVLLKL